MRAYCCLLICLAPLVVLPSCQAGGMEKLAFIIERQYTPRKAGEQVTIAIDYQEAVKRLPALGSNRFTITDMNFGKPVEAKLVDHNNDNRPDKIVFDFTFASTEPVFTFYIQSSGKRLPASTGSVSSDERIKAVFLTSAREALDRGKPVRSWPDEIIGSTMAFYPDPATLTLYEPGKWSYELGFFLSAAFVRWQETKNDDYLNYIKGWADHFIDVEGNINPAQYRVKEYKLDDILPGRVLLSLYDVTRDERYQRAATQLHEHLLIQPKTSEGGYWHKQIYPYQMWLDGIYMADIFNVQYAAAFGKPEGYDEAIHQIKLIARHTTDPATGLLYHGWDESKNKVWAHPERGTSPEFWGRAIGWYIMALIECLDYIPEDHPGRKDVIDIFQKLAHSLARYQDPQAALWYQVIDKGGVPGNWFETSCSAMFAYAFAKGHRKGLLDESFRQRAQQAFDALVNDYVYFDDAGRLYFDQTVKVGTLNPKTSKGDFAYYITTERRINDYKGLGALLYASLELSPRAEQ